MAGLLDLLMNGQIGPGYDLGALPPVPVSAAEMAQNPAARAVMRAQQHPASALEGELGVYHNPYGGYSTELSQTVADPRLNNNAPTNIPMLVNGQSVENLRRILAGQAGQQEQEIAIRRAMERVQSGQQLPAFLTFQRAIEAAGNRSANKQGPWR